MNVFLLNVLYAVIWAAFYGSFTVSVLVTGFMAGFLVLCLPLGIKGQKRYRDAIFQPVAFVAIYLVELVASSIRVARDVIRPDFRMQSAVVGVPLSAKSNLEITMLANLVSLTPGTLTVDLSEDRSTLYVHVMDMEDGDANAFRRKLKGTLEQRVLRLIGTADHEP
jgi:multicomponent Na+:H+ antiporter subunit E